MTIRSENVLCQLVTLPVFSPSFFFLFAFFVISGKIRQKLRALDIMPKDIDELWDILDEGKGEPCPLEWWEVWGDRRPSKRDEEEAEVN